MKREGTVPTSTVLIPGVVSLAASTRRTLKHGDSFGMFDEFGDVLEVELSPFGLFHHDTRFLSRLQFTLESHRPLMLSSTVQTDNMTLDVDLTNPDMFADGELVLAKDTFHVARTKYLWQAGCYELFTVTSYAERAQRLRLALEFDADFADLFEIRGHPRARRGAVRAEVRGADEVLFTYDSVDGVPRATRLRFSITPSVLGERRAEFDLELGARQRRALALSVHCEQGTTPPQRRTFFSALRQARRARNAARAGSPAIESSNSVFNSVLERSSADLAMLTTETPHGPYPYAGVPGFSTVFGRDGLITALEMLWFDPSIARGVLRFLAAHQGTREDPAADMEPGKILHEMRECELARLGEVPFGRYYGSVDSTPLFVARALPVEARERDEKRRRVDRAVVAAERHLAEPRELALAQLVQDLAGLHVGGRVLAPGLVRREKAQHAPRRVGVEPEHLHRGEEAVAAEHGREPRYAGVRIGAERRLGLEHLEIGARARQNAVDGDV